jgi:hypothetical protein
MPACLAIVSCGSTDPNDLVERPAVTSRVGSARRGSVALTILLAAAGARATLVPCRQPADTAQVSDALDRIRRSIDPCGESAQVLAVVEKVEHCPVARYEICTDGLTSRNLLEPHDADEPGTIIWNPRLRSELERGCDGDPARPVVRDPVASLLHEMVHAVDDCEGRDASAHELEAVRIENIYRRAAGLCQRTTYGDTPLASEMVKRCSPGHCECGPAAPASASQQTPPATAHQQVAGPPATGEASSGLAGDGLIGPESLGHVRHLWHFVPRITQSPLLQR